MEEMHLREYVRVLRKHMWLMLACFVVVLGTVALGTYLQRPIFRATTRALLDREAPRVVNFQEAGPSGEPLEVFQTQVQIIRSRPVGQRVIDTLDLKSKKPELALAADPVEAFLGSVSVEPVRNTRLVEIQVEDPDPKLAAEMANAVASAYVYQNLELKLYAAQSEVSSERRGSIRFYPDGSSTGGRITVAAGERKYLVDVDWLTGRVSINE